MKDRSPLRPRQESICAVASRRMRPYIFLAWLCAMAVGVHPASCFSNSASPASKINAIRSISNPRHSTISSTALSMGLLDAFSKAFENTKYGPPPESVKATARHILVPTKGEAQVIMKMIASGEESFENCARQFSTCPSSSKGGSLGSFGPGTMVPEFDKVIFAKETKIGELLGPVLTNFGYHVIVVDKRTGGGDLY
ncbi:parvulin-like peptidyl-prolyl isomerase [Nitzschia inconspicua]|uniref:Peptidyl-prolyl cis-trans isomerase n=1 Tax=Nitzschia inconspicua TaxID=303405 RepID=A0A9K3PBP3_9STRA|nr:parvulin-like peptidyl-prolyl isomerase [Nitzschia inconspicua]